MICIATYEENNLLPDFVNIYPYITLYVTNGKIDVTIKVNIIGGHNHPRSYINIDECNSSLAYLWHPQLCATPRVFMIYFYILCKYYHNNDKGGGIGYANKD